MSKSAPASAAGIRSAPPGTITFMISFHPDETPNPESLNPQVGYDGRPLSELKQEHEKMLQELSRAASKLDAIKQLLSALSADQRQPRPLLGQDCADSHFAQSSETDSADCDTSSEQRQA